MEARHQQGSFLVSANLIFPCPLVKWVGSSTVLSYHQVLVANQEHWQSPFVVLWVSVIPLINNLRGGIPHLTLGVLFGSLWLLEGTLPLCMVTGKTPSYEENL